MNNDNYPYERRSNVPGILVGALIGGITGAVAMLLLAPRAGEETRLKIQEKMVDLRDQANAKVKDAVASVQSQANRLTVEGREKIDELKQQGQDLAVEQLDRVAEAAKAGKKAIKNS